MLKNGAPKSDKRQHMRVRVNFEVLYEVDQPPQVRMLIGDQEVRATMLDLSEIGMAILTSYAIPKTATLFIRFTLLYKDEESRPMLLNGEVCYDIPLSRDQHRLGIRFTQIKNKDRQAIIDFVKIYN